MDFAEFFHTREVVLRPSSTTSAGNARRLQRSRANSRDPCRAATLERSLAAPIVSYRSAAKSPIGADAQEKNYESLQQSDARNNRECESRCNEAGIVRNKKRCNSLCQTVEIKNQRSRCVGWAECTIAAKHKEVGAEQAHQCCTYAVSFHEARAKVFYRPTSATAAGAALWLQWSHRKFTCAVRLPSGQGAAARWLGHTFHLTFNLKGIGCFLE
jgi:hypothetical protein